MPMVYTHISVLEERGSFRFYSPRTDDVMTIVDSSYNHRHLALVLPSSVGASLLTRKEDEAGIRCLQMKPNTFQRDQTPFREAKHMQLIASVVSQFQQINLFRCGGRETTTGLGRHGFPLQEVLEQDEGLRRAVLGHRVPGAADGDEGQAFILHAPAPNLPPQHMHMAMDSERNMKLGDFTCPKQH